MIVKKIKICTLSLALFAFLPVIVFAGNDILDDYIKLGLENNLVLQQKRQNYRMSLELLNEAKGLFYPSLSINMRYTLASGGRVIEFPAGDLLNPVYSTLNMLTGSQDFQSISNESFPFYRPREQESKLRLVHQVFNTSLWYNRKIKELEKEVGYIDIEIYRRSLVAEIKKAYFNYLTALKVEEIIKESISLLEENVRVNEKLAANDLITFDNVYRSLAELSKAEQQLTEAEGNRKISAAMFNFLLNRPLDKEIEISEVSEFDRLITEPFEERFDVSNREELQKVAGMVQIANDFVRLKRSEYYPQLTAVVEYGLQGRSYSPDRSDDFVLASIVLTMPLFEGFQNRSGVRQAKIRSNLMNIMQLELEQQLSLEIINAWYEMEASDKAIVSASRQVQSARSAFNLIRKRFNEGNTSLLEFIDSRTSMTNAEINLIISKFDFYSKFADYEKAAALYSFDQAY